MNLLWHKIGAVGPIFIGANGQKLKNNLAIWAHWFEIDPPNRQLLKAHFVSISIVAKESFLPNANLNWSKHIWLAMARYLNVGSINDKNN